MYNLHTSLDFFFYFTLPILEAEVFADFLNMEQAIPYMKLISNMAPFLFMIIRLSASRQINSSMAIMASAPIQVLLVSDTCV